MPARIALRMRISTAALLTLLFAASCATPMPQRDRAVERLIDRLATASIDERVAMTATPFLFDREIVIRDIDIETLWRNLDDAGFSFADVSLASIEPIASNEWPLLADAAELQVWRDAHRSADAAWVAVDHPIGRILIVTDGRHRFAPMIAGFVTAEALR